MDSAAREVSAEAEIREIDDLLAEYGIHSGFPLGMLEGREITTDDPLIRHLADQLAGKKEEEPADDQEYYEEDGVRWIVHRSWDPKFLWRGTHGTVKILRHPVTGMHRMAYFPYNRTVLRLSMLIETTGMATYQRAEAERTAQGRLFKALSERQRDLYTLTGTFVETGASGVSYLLRKGRPTIAYRVVRDPPADREDGCVTLEPLCALCMHPLAYYTYTWTGAMPPSDEVLACLLFIRSDEKALWRIASQLPLDTIASGV